MGRRRHIGTRRGRRRISSWVRTTRSRNPGLAWLAALGLRAEADAADVARARHDDAGLALATERARRIAARLPPPERIPPAPGRGVGSRSCRCAGRAGAPGGPDGADPAAWEDAGEAWEAVERPFPAAYCRARQGEALLASRGSREAARSAFAMARETAVRLGAPRSSPRSTCSLVRRAWISPNVRAGGRGVPSDTGHRSRGARADRARAGGPQARRRRLVEPADRRCAVHHPQDRLGARLEHPGQARRPGRTEAAAIAHRLGLGRDAPPPPDSDAVA